MKKKLSILGIVVGIVFMLLGLLAVYGALGDTTSASGAPHTYDSGYAQFGTDYYTYSVNNAAEAASAARTAANNLNHIYKFIETFCGIASMLFGLALVAGFGIVLSHCNEDAARNYAQYFANNINNDNSNISTSDTDKAVDNTDVSNTTVEVSARKKKYDSLVAKAERFKDTFFERDYRIRTYESIVKDMEILANENFEDSAIKLKEYTTHLEMLKSKIIK